MLSLQIKKFEQNKVEIFFSQHLRYARVRLQVMFHKRRSFVSF